MNQAELQKKAQEDDALYERFASQLEAEHSGEYVAVARDGRLIVSPADVQVLRQALQVFGRGNFAFRRIGYRVMGRIR